MPVISREHVDKDIRASHEKAYRVQLKKALTNPLLTPEERIHIQTSLKTIGQPKVYLEDSPPKPGAISLEEDNA